MVPALTTPGNTLLVQVNTASHVLNFMGFHTAPFLTTIGLAHMSEISGVMLDVMEQKPSFSMSCTCRNRKHQYGTHVQGSN